MCYLTKKIMLKNILILVSLFAFDRYELLKDNKLLR